MQVTLDRDAPRRSRSRHRVPAADEGVRRRSYLEAGRLMALREHRDLRATLALYRHVLGYAIDAGLDGIVMTCGAHLVRYYERLGFLRVAGPFQRKGVCNATDWVMLLDLRYERMNAIKWLFALAVDLPRGRGSLAWRSFCRFVGATFGRRRALGAAAARP